MWWSRSRSKARGGSICNTSRGPRRSRERVEIDLRAPPPTYGSGMAHPLAGKPALPASVLVDLAALERAYFDDHRTCRSPISASRSAHPDIATPRRSFDEDHIVAIAAAVADYREAERHPRHGDGHHALSVGAGADGGRGADPRAGVHVAIAGRRRRRSRLARRHRSFHTLLSGKSRFERRARRCGFCCTQWRGSSR